VLGAGDLDLQKQAYYNLGNTLYRQGQQTEPSDPRQTMQQWEQALTAYAGTLAIDPDHADARYNHDFVKRRLEELKQQQEQQEQEQEQQEQEQEQEQVQQPDQGSHGNAPNDETGESGSDQDSQPSPDSSNGDQEPENGSDKRSDGESRQPESPDGQDQAQDEAPETHSAQPEPSPVGHTPSPSPVDERRARGLMTPEEAENLLDSLKDEDGKAPFVPMSSGRAGKQDDDSRRDW
jgi:Ca-activated chloride channel family protein